MRRLLFALAIPIFGAALVVAQSSSTQRSTSTTERRTQTQQSTQPAESTPPATAQPQSQSDQPQASESQARAETTYRSQQTTTSTTHQTPAGPTSSSTADMPWIWIIAGLGVIVLLLIVAMTARGGTSERV